MFVLQKQSNKYGENPKNEGESQQNIGARGFKKPTLSCMHRIRLFLQRAPISILFF